MAFYAYRSRTRFKEDEIDGVNTKFNVRLEGVGKSNQDDHPYIIANEYISACLASYLRLPIPPFSLMRKKSASTRMFVTIRFDDAKPAKDCEPSIFCKTFPFESSGVVLFDILIANVDRHKGNIKVDNPAKPKRFHLFDHDRALLYCHKGKGKQWLRKYWDDPAIGPFHVLPPEIQSFEYLSEWASRIRDIPDWYIEDVCNHARKIGATKSEIDLVQEFIIHRRDKIGKLVPKTFGLFNSAKGNRPLFV